MASAAGATLDDRDDHDLVIPSTFSTLTSLTGLYLELDGRLEVPELDVSSLYSLTALQTLHLGCDNKMRKYEHNTRLISIEEAHGFDSTGPYS